MEPRRESVTHCWAVKGGNSWALTRTNVLQLMRWWGRESRMETVSKQEKQETVIQDFVSPKGEKMFRLDIYCKTQEALKLTFDTGHFCFFPNLQPTFASHTQEEDILWRRCVCSRVWVQLHPLYTRSHYCSLSRPGLIVSHLTASQLCTKLAACCRKRLRRWWRILKNM